MVKIVPLGSLTLLKRSGILENIKFEYKYYVELFCLAKVIPKTRFLAAVEGFWPVLGAGWGEPTTRGLQDPRKSKIQKPFLF